MIRFRNAWFVALAAGLGVMTAQAQPAVSVLTVNLADAYDGYYKTTEANNKLRVFNSSPKLLSTYLTF